MKVLEQFRITVRTLFVLIMSAAFSAVYAVVGFSAYNSELENSYRLKGSLLIIAVYFAVNMFVTFAFNAHKIDEQRRSEVILSEVMAILVSNTIAYAQVSIISAKLVTPAPLILVTLAQFLFTIPWVFISTAVVKRLNPPEDMIVIYGSHAATELVMKMAKMPDKYLIRESVNVTEGLQYVLERADAYRSVIICDVPARMRNDILKHCYGKGKPVYVVPKISDVIIRGASDITYFDCPLLHCMTGGLTLEQRILKRGFDLLLSSLALIVLSPLLLFISLAIKLCDGGPVFYRQERQTIGGRHFNIIKFRSMIPDAENGAPLPAVENDSRVTPVGKILRALRLDELPQLLNIIKGDMSIVGPRPERVEHVKAYTEAMPEFSYRYNVKGGLTGYAQVFGKYNTSPYNKLKLDLMYIQHYSLILDIKIIVMTVKILFKRDSAEGFDEPYMYLGGEGDSSHE